MTASRDISYHRPRRNQPAGVFRVGEPTELHDRLLEAVGAVFGESPAAKLARFGGIDLRVAQYILKGRTEPHMELVERLEAQAEIVKRLNVQPHLYTVVKELRAAGVDDEVIAGQLQMAHFRALNRKMSG